MNREQFSGTQEHADLGLMTDATQVQAANIHAGSMLKTVRESTGLHIAALAVMLKVPVKKLEAMEAGRFDLLPDAVFVRALAASICRNLKVDATAILELLPPTETPKFAYQRTPINTPFRSPGDFVKPSVWSQTSKPAVLAGLVLVFGALMLIFLPNFRLGVKQIEAGLKSFSAGSSSEKVIEPFPASLTPLADTQKVLLFAPVAGDAVSVTSSTLLIPAGSNTPGATEQKVAAEIGSQSSALSGNTLPQITDVLLFTAKAESWVEATDSRGKTVLRRTLTSGEVVGATGALPLSVVVGRADAIEVQIRGKSFDLTAVANNNVARFEVK